MTTAVSRPHRDTAMLLTLTVLSVMLALAVLSLQPPQALGENTPAAEFSGIRAVNALRYLLGDETPHPVGSDANRAVRDRLMESLRQLGLEPQIQATVGCSSKWSVCANVENVVAEIPGETHHALVLMAHYDSVPHAPGAADDGSGVVTLLESARALLTEPARRNRILLVFTDAEEMGLLGAEGFFAEHPWVADVQAVINVEGGGSGGPSLLLRSSNPGGHLLETFRDAVASPAAFSYAQEVFARMPNDTDFTVSDRAGIASIDFAFAFEFNHYHTPLDTVDNLDPGSVQHHGSYVLPLARRLADADLSESAANFSYLTLMQSWWITWPESWTVGLAALGLAGLLVAAIRLRSIVAAGALGAGLGLATITLLLGVLCCFVGIWVADLILGTTVSFPAHPNPWRLLMAAAALLPVCMIGWWAAGRLHFWALFLGVWLLLGGFALAAAVAAPLAANLFILPVLAASGLCVIAVFVADTRSRRVQNTLAITASALPALVLLTVAVAMEETQGMRLAPTIYVPLVLTMLPLLPLVPGPRFSGTCAALMVLAWIWAAAAPLYSDWRPQHVSLYYVLNHDEGTARWAAVSANPIPGRVIDAFGAQPLPAQLFPWSTPQQTPTFPAEVIELPRPDVSTRRSGDNVTLRVRSRTGGDFIHLVIPESAGVTNLVVAERPVEATHSDGFTYVRFFALGDEELMISFTTSQAEPINGFVVDGSHTLPTIATPFLASRGTLAVPQHQGDQQFAFQRVSM